MSVLDIIFIGVAVAMDACAVGLTNGVTNPKMHFGRVLTVALAFAFFQFYMPLVGYAFGSFFEKWVSYIAPWLAFFLLGLIGGKMLVDSIKELREKKEGKIALRKKTPELTAAKLLIQAIATSIDALAVGVTLLASESVGGLPMHATLCMLVFGVITFALSFGAVYLGKKAGQGVADRTEITELGGGMILLLIGIKILIEGLLA